MGKLGEKLRAGLWAPFRLLVPKSPWLRLVLLLLAVVVAAAFLEPFLNLLGRGLDLLARIVTPLLHDPIGRLVLLNLMLLGVLLLAVRLLRERWRRLRSGMILREHLRGIDRLLADEPQAAGAAFLRVATSRAAPPPDCQFLASDARLKLARLALAAGEASEAMAHLARARSRELPKELQRSRAQLHAQACLQHGEILPEGVERELREACAQLGDDLGMLQLLRRVVRGRGDLAETAALQERIHRLSPPRSKPAARMLWLEDLAAAGAAALQTGDRAAARSFARRARNADPEHPTGGLLLGDVLEAEGEPQAALREWGRTRSWEGLERISALLDRHPLRFTPRELLESCPVEGALLLVARELARAGETRKALRAARRAARRLGPTPTVTRMLVSVLELCGNAAEAEQLRQEASTRLLAPPPPQR
jgi:tetratricopeptide (TPR) repeat protein